MNRVWKDRGWKEDVAREWYSAGFDDPIAADRFYAVGFDSPKVAYKWYAAGVSAAEAKKADSEDMQVGEYLALRGGFTVEDIEESFPCLAKQMRKEGKAKLSAIELRRWIESMKKKTSIMDKIKELFGFRESAADVEEVWNKAPDASKLLSCIHAMDGVEVTAIMAAKWGDVMQIVHNNVRGVMEHQYSVSLSDDAIDWLVTRCLESTLSRKSDYGEYVDEEAKKVWNGAVPSAWRLP